MVWGGGGGGPESRFGDLGQPLALSTVLLRPNRSRYRIEVGSEGFGPLVCCPLPCSTVEAMVEGSRIPETA